MSNLKRWSPVIRVSLWIVVMSFSGLTTQAADSVWTNLAGGDFNEAGNWSAGVPGSGDNARFLSNATYTVTLTQSWTNNNGIFNAVGGRVSLDAGASTWTLTNNLQVGTNTVGHATLAVTSGVVAVGAFVKVGAFSRTDDTTGASNRLEIASGAQLSSVGAAIGYNAAGNSAGSTYNLVLIDGAGSKWVDTGTGQLGGQNYRTGNYNRIVVTNGGYVEVKTLGVYGAYNEILVTETNSEFCNTGEITMGAYGPGNRITVTNGGFFNSVSVVKIYGGAFPAQYCNGSTIEVVGQGSLWRRAATTYIDGTNNSVIIRGGAASTNKTDSIYYWMFGASSNRYITLLVADTGTVFASDEMGSDAVGAGTDPAGIIVSNGATLRVVGACKLGYSINAYGGRTLVTGTGSTFTIAAGKDLRVAANSAAASNAHLLTICDGGSFVVGRDAYLGGYSASMYVNMTGTVVVADSGSYFEAATLNVGNYGQGFLTVTNYAKVKVTNTLNVGYGATSQSNRVDVHRGELEVVGAANCTRGTITISSTGVMTSASMTVGAAGTLRFVADAEGFGQILFPSGNMTIDPAARLEVDVGGYRFSKGMNFVLVDYGALTGGNTFAASNVVVVGKQGGTVDQITDEVISVHLYMPGGTIVTIR